MLADLVKVVGAEVSGEAAKQHVARIIQHHRIQASPGIRAAAHDVLNILQRSGIAAEIMVAPAREGVRFWGQHMFQEWEGRSASLHIVSPPEEAAKLCDFREIPISLIQRSIATPPVDAELVWLNDGTELAHYEGLDVENKIVLTSGRLDRVRDLAVEQFGAMGIVFYGMRDFAPVRPEMDLPDARQYTSFWWFGGEKRCFGFVLSPRRGEALRRLVTQRALKGQDPVIVRAVVDSRFCDGEMEIVSACLPGETDEEVVVVAHLCHPRPSANDNASGCGAALEAAQALHSLITSGRLPTPKRSIRFLWLPEMTGTYAYLATNEARLPGMVAGVNLDMVGEDQDKCGSVWIVEYPPEAMPSFAGDLMVRVRDELSVDLSNLAGNQRYATFRQGVSPFSGGSDHYIFSDPTFGVPTPMLIQWPDRYYHTSEDTLDKVSAAMLAQVGTVTASYAYFVASAGRREAEWLAEEMLARTKAASALRVQSFVTRAATAGDAESLGALLLELERKLAYWTENQERAIDSVITLSQGARGVVQDVQGAVRGVLTADAERGRAFIRRRAIDLGTGELTLPTPPANPWAEQAAKIVPHRLFPGPVTTTRFEGGLPSERREEIYRWRQERRLENLTILALYWVDGKRTLSEIAEKVEMESGLCDDEYLVRHFRLLEELGLIEISMA